jgi:hypothetical protein
MKGEAFLVSPKRHRGFPVQADIYSDGKEVKRDIIE